jgi:hypothetical protein
VKLNKNPRLFRAGRSQPICFNVRVGVREKLKAVPDWKERLREFVDSLIVDVESLNDED